MSLYYNPKNMGLTLTIGNQSISIVGFDLAEPEPKIKKKKKFFHKKKKYKWYR